MVTNERHMTALKRSSFNNGADKNNRKRWTTYLMGVLMNQSIFSLVEACESMDREPGGRSRPGTLRLFNNSAVSSSSNIWKVDILWEAWFRRITAKTAAGNEKKDTNLLVHEEKKQLVTMHNRQHTALTLRSCYCVQPRATCTPPTQKRCEVWHRSISVARQRTRCRLMQFRWKLLKAHLQRHRFFFKLRGNKTTKNSFVNRTNWFRLALPPAQPSSFWEQIPDAPGKDNTLTWLSADQKSLHRLNNLTR